MHLRSCDMSCRTVLFIFGAKLASSFCWSYGWCSRSLMHTDKNQSCFIYSQESQLLAHFLSQAPSKHLQTSVPGTGWIYGSGRDQHSSDHQLPRLHELPRWEAAEKEVRVGMEWEGSWELERLRTEPPVF